MYFVRKIPSYQKAKFFKYCIEDLQSPRLLETIGYFCQSPKVQNHPSHGDSWDICVGFRPFPSSKAYTSQFLMGKHMDRCRERRFWNLKHKICEKWNFKDQNILYIPKTAEKTSCKASKSAFFATSGSFVFDFGPNFFRTIRTFDVPRFGNKSSGSSGSVHFLRSDFGCYFFRLIGRHFWLILQ